MSGKKRKSPEVKHLAVANKVTKKSKIEMVAPETLVKLDLACGQNCREGFAGVDAPGTKAHIEGEIVKIKAKAERTPEDDKRIGELTKAFENVKYEFNLFKFPWPFEDNSVDEIHTSHFIEHIPMIEVDERGNQVPFGEGKDLFFAFADECYRVLKNDSWITFVTPCLRSNRAFQDPTHRRFFPAEAFYYLWKGFREANRLDHYKVQCNFVGNVENTVAQEMTLKSTEAQTRAYNEAWNAIWDFHAKMQAKKDA